MGTWSPGPGPTNGDDVFTGDGSDEFVRGEDGNDTLVGGAGNDTLFGDGGNDNLQGGDGDDELLDDLGDNILSGGAGNDLFRPLYTGGVGGINTISGGDGDDYVQIVSNGSAVFHIDGGSGADFLQASYGIMLAGSTLTGVETFILTQNGVVLEPSILSGISNVWAGGGGITLLSAGTVDFSAVNMPSSFTVAPPSSPSQTFSVASFSFTGSAGDDTLILPVAAQVSVTANGGAGNDVLRGGAMNDWLVGGDGDDILEGYGGADTILLVGGHDTANGGDGDDLFIVSRFSTSEIDGGAGSDVLQFVPATASGEINGLASGASIAGVETIALVGSGLVTLSPNVLPAGITLLLGGATLTSTGPGTFDLSRTTMPSSFVFGGQSYNFASLGYQGSGGDDTVLMPTDAGARLNVHGNDGDDIIQGGASDDFIFGDAGNDTLGGGAGADNLAGGGGDDHLDGGAGDDSLDGGAGMDVLVGGLGNDAYYVDDAGDTIFEISGQGSDTLLTWFANVTVASFTSIENLTYLGALSFIGQGDAGANILEGGPGNDYFYAYAGDDTARGNAGVDVFIMAEGNDTVFGGDGQDYIYGDAGNDTLRGEGGVDVMLGGEGADTMFGGDEGDFFYGENGDDIAFGEAGNDIFVMAAGNDTASGGAGQDYFYMGDGNDTLNGGDGVDVMLGEAGDDVFNPGLGVDYVFLGTGSDTLNVDKTLSGVTVLNDFTAGVSSADLINLTGTGWTSFAQVQANIFDYTASGGFCILALDADTAIWFIGVQPSQLTAGDFVFGP